MYRSRYDLGPDEGFEAIKSGMAGGVDLEHVEGAETDTQRDTSSQYLPGEGTYE